MEEPAVKVQALEEKLSNPLHVVDEVSVWRFSRELDPLLGQDIADGMAARICIALGAAWLRIENYAKALPYAEAAVRWAPLEPVSYTNLGHALLGLGREREAAEVLLDGVDKLGERRDFHAMVLFANLAEALSTLGLTEEAERAFVEAESCDEGTVAEAFVLAAQAADVGDWPRAIRHMARVLMRLAGQPDDDERASEIVAGAWSLGNDVAIPHNLDRVIRVHRAMVHERERLTAVTEPDVSEETAVEAALRDLAVLEEMRPLREEANRLAFAEAGSLGQASH